MDHQPSDPQKETSLDPSMISQTYLSFDELISTPLTERLLVATWSVLEKGTMKDASVEILTSLCDSASWKNQFESLDQLRVLNKLHSEFFTEKAIPALIECLIDLSDSIRSNLQKNALLLLTEIIQVNPLSRIAPDHLHLIQKSLFEKAISEKSFIKSQARQAIKELNENVNALLPFNLNGIQSICFDKNPIICELASTSLQSIITIHEQQISSIDKPTLTNLAESLLKFIQGKRAVMKKQAKEIAGIILQTRGNAAFDQMAEQDRQALIEAVNQPKNDQKPSFRDFLALKKKIA